MNMPSVSSLMFQCLRLHCGVNVLYVVILLDALDELLYICLCITLKDLEVNVWKTGEFCSDELIAIVRQFMQTKLFIFKIQNL